MKGNTVFATLLRRIFPMLIENSGLNGLKSDLAFLDESAESLGFVRWQWEYYRATYDLKFVDRGTNNEYFLRFSTRTVEGKLENPAAVLAIESVYIGRATFPHGLDYESAVPQPILSAAQQKLADLKNKLAE
jgi:hypothetical protein